MIKSEHHIQEPLNGLEPLKDVKKIKDLMKTYVLRAYITVGYNKERLARELGVSSRTIKTWLIKYGVHKKLYKKRYPMDISIK